MQEDELKEKIEAGEADESAWDHMPLPAITYVRTILKPASATD